MYISDNHNKADDTSEFDTAAHMIVSVDILRLTVELQVPLQAME
jgi:hypothetical protein